MFNFLLTASELSRAVCRGCTPKLTRKMKTYVKLEFMVHQTVLVPNTYGCFPNFAFIRSWMAQARQMNETETRLYHVNSAQAKCIKSE